MQPLAAYDKDQVLDIEMVLKRDIETPKLDLTDDGIDESQLEEGEKDFSENKKYVGQMLNGI